MSSAKKANKKVAKVEQPAKYPTIEAKVYARGTDAGTITPAMARELMGWETEPPGGEWDAGEVYLTDKLKNKVRVSLNAHNRPLNMGHAQSLAQDILNGNWADSLWGPGVSLNGEAIIIGRHGNVLSGQHRLVALIFADQLHRLAPDDYPAWKGKEVSLEGVIIYGVSEDKRVLRTLDNVRPRTLADVLFSEGLFRGKNEKARVVLTKTVDSAIRFLWSRLGLGQDAWSPHRTHSEAEDFLTRHKTLVKCVEHLYDENDKKAITRNCPLGLASAVCYLMATSASDGSIYKDAHHKSEKLEGVNTDRVEEAQAFWSVFAHGPELGALHTALNPTVGKLRVEERAALLVKAWDAWLQKKPVTAEVLDMSSHYLTDPNSGQVTLADLPKFGGIDCFDPEEGTPEPEEIPEPAEDPGIAAIEAIRGNYPDGTLVLYQDEMGRVIGYGSEAEVLAAAHGGEVKAGKYRLAKADVEMTLDEVVRQGHSLVIALHDGSVDEESLVGDPSK